MNFDEKGNGKTSKGLNYVFEERFLFLLHLYSIHSIV